MPLDLEIALTLNGVARRVRVDATMSALQMLRDVVGLTGTKLGCGEGECGACTVLVDGVAQAACLLYAVDCDGRSLTTIEGLAAHPVARALEASLVAHGAVQCGFCTPGVVVQGTHLLAHDPHPDAATVARGLEGNLCRCTGYRKIIEAVVDAGAAR